MSLDHIAVIDIGKTNAKLALVNATDLSEVAVVTQPNRVLPGPPYPHFDVETIWAFLLDALRRFHQDYGIGAISVTTHGASGALIAADGTLAAPVLDYEHTGPDQRAAAYDAVRPPFTETGSPRLSMGLNLGAQIDWQFAQDPSLRGRTKTIVTYPQYWGHRLTGEVACDVSSLGAHTDLWDPHRRQFSALVDRLDIRALLAPAKLPSEVLGQIRPEVAATTGLRPETVVRCGIHDSNASLLPHILQRDPPFSVVSTGTWVIAMTVGGQAVTLDPSRDTLMNVNALGAPVSSARFMGGREYEIIRDGQDSNTPGAGDAIEIAELPLLMPAVVPESGPFQGRQHHWIPKHPATAGPERGMALSFYLALMTAECLSLTGHQGPVVVEGPFAANKSYCDMLTTVTDCPVLTAASATGTSQGAALLALDAPNVVLRDTLQTVSDARRAVLGHYANRWRTAVAGARD